MDSVTTSQATMVAVLELTQTLVCSWALGSYPAEGGCMQISA